MKTSDFYYDLPKEFIAQTPTEPRDHAKLLVYSREKKEILHKHFYNLPDYDDEYIDPELKKELEEVARLKNPNAVQPSLEKQMSCIISATGSYTYETLQEISIRKLVLLLRTIDARLHYFAYRQGELSGRKITMPLYIVKCIVKLIELLKET